MTKKNSRLAEFRDYLKLTQTDIAQKIGIHQRNWSRYENGDVSTPDSVLLKLSKLGLNLHWYHTGIGNMTFQEQTTSCLFDYQRKQPKGQQDNLSLAKVSNQKDQAKTITHHTPLPVVHEVSDGIIIPLLEQEVSAGKGKDLREDNLPALYLNIPSKYGKYGDLYALPVRGDSMYPTLDEGDLVVCDSGGWDGDGIYVIKSQECAFVKRVTLSSKGYTVISDNEAYPAYSESKEDIAIVGKVRCAVVRFK